MELETNGKDIRIYGDNATGKTTIFDAFLWLLFDKDSQNRADFAIKTLNSDGTIKHRLDHEVEGTFDKDGEIVTLRKIYREKWTKRRGSTIEEFTGHETDHFIDGIPVKKSEYTDFIAQIAPEEQFRLLTNPAYFNEQMHWTDRRKLLIEISGDVSLEDVIKANPRLSKLSSILGKRDPDKYKAAVMAKRNAVNKELERIPIRIDEVIQNMPDISMIEHPENIDTDLKKLSDGKAQKESELVKLLSGGDIGSKKQRVAIIESELLKIENEHKRKVTAEMDKLQDKIRDLEITIKNKKDGLEQAEERINERVKQVEIIELKMQVLRDRWYLVNSQTGESDIDEICPACGQDLPEEQVEKATARFNVEKARQLQSITEQGQQFDEKVKALRAAIDIDQEQMTVMEESLEKMTEQSSTLQAELAKLKSSMDDYEALAEYRMLVAEQDNFQRAIKGDQSAIEPERARLQDEINRIGQAIDALTEAKARLELHKQAKARIAELEEQERELAKAFERLEEELFLIEDFTRTKADMLTDKINSKFRLAKFKLFEEQVNGGVNPICETTYNGVPYSSGLNSAARINVGLDIINTLSEHFGFSAPIFVDNAEAVTELIPVNGQLISLIVSEKDKTLRIEGQAQEAKQQTLFEEAI